MHQQTLREALARFAAREPAAHLHYDLRFLFEADPREVPLANAESYSVRWAALGELSALGCDASVPRMAERCRRAFGESVALRG